ncbi:hypothetical protein ASPZODRAFT_135115 [Penicilliopsis zonata CBS 506.65]|uniref:DUF1168 domain protein n=1 Tax=Penicilliopsis zonata CBS 506.65 TaxID=1073090 RepID=A0A1L9SB17_9EURO|nr:hypothetical protein ASPZODRAFT_135115 [Penicilliopsis zonata CBS 506.65]OJJ44309.1 hypothetical protein ASPZODRAFT_135115 [Penicilliopsis zonata CBS 506.65]
MSEPGPESIPTSADPRSKRPLKRRAITPVSEQASQIESLFRDPNKEIQLPRSTKERKVFSLAAPPEIVANVQGSSSGAGSGEFHVYKASRRREYERLRLMNEETEKEKDNAEWEQKQSEAKRKDDEKTEKNRRKREKRKAAKNGNNGKKDEMEVDKQVKRGVAKPMIINRAKDGEQGQHQQQTSADGGADASAYEVPGVIIHDED